VFCDYSARSQSSSPRVHVEHHYIAIESGCEEQRRTLSVKYDLAKVQSGKVQWGIKWRGSDDREREVIAN
jgi:hypothetical protein